MRGSLPGTPGGHEIAGRGMTAGRDLDLGRLLDALEEGVLLVDQDFVIGANPSLGRMAGVAPERLVGEPVGAWLADEEGRPVNDPRSPAACRLRDARGELIPIDVKSVDARLHLLMDRSRERRLEGEVWRLSSRLRAGPSEEARSEAREGSAESLGMVEHEIRTATTVIRGYARMLLEQRAGPLTDLQRTFLGEAERATGRISALLDNLLALSSLDAPSGCLFDHKPVDVHEVVRAAASALHPTYAERALELRLELDARSSEVRGDPERLEQVVLNLLGNAAKFSPEGGKVDVLTELRRGESGPELVLSVSDSGPGISRAEKERIFRPFVQGSAATRGGAQGVGLGLAICRRIVEGHLGVVEAIPDVGHGLFRVALPLNHPPTRTGSLGAPGGPAEPGNAADASARSPGGRRAAR